MTKVLSTSGRPEAKAENVDHALIRGLICTATSAWTPRLRAA
jgi:hypothetical protein